MRLFQKVHLLHLSDLHRLYHPHNEQIHEVLSLRLKTSKNFYKLEVLIIIYISFFYIPRRN